VDGVTVACEACGGVMRRVPEVLDGWFDAGAMPFAQRGYPRAGRELFEQTYPADFICEAIDQTRGWFYSLLAISTLLFKQNAYRNVICLGHILDPEGQKMSKSKGNVMDPDYIFDSFGADALRWLFFISPVGESYSVGDKPLQEVVRRFLLTFWNVYSFFVTYANIDGFRPGAQAEVPLAERPVLDRWLLSRLNHLVDGVDRSLERYDVNSAARPIEDFVEDLSNWYLRRSRRRFWKSESDSDKLAAYQTLHQALVTLSRLMAPFTPFLADTVHRNLAQGRSVHLEDFPGADRAALDAALDGEMRHAREVVEAGLAARDRARVKVRQPLSSFAYTGDPLPEELAQIVMDELNVKQLQAASEAYLDTELTEELRLEGIAREVVRQIQSERKRLDFNIDDRITTYYLAGGRVAAAFQRFAGYIAAETLSLDLVPERPAGLEGATFNLEDTEYWIGLKRTS
jgi:isoleucyl-tRNA synthetase